jgi:hypothetical protein
MLQVALTEYIDSCNDLQGVISASEVDQAKVEAALSKSLLRTYTLRTILQQMQLEHPSAGIVGQNEPNERGEQSDPQTSDSSASSQSSDDDASATESEDDLTGRFDIQNRPIARCRRKFRRASTAYTGGTQISQDTAVHSGDENDEDTWERPSKQQRSWS